MLCLNTWSVLCLNTVLTRIQSIAEELSSFVLSKVVIHFKANCFRVSADLNPVDMPLIASVQVQGDRGDTADTAASTRHAEDVQANIWKQNAHIAGFFYVLPVAQLK